MNLDVQTEYRSDAFQIKYPDQNPQAFNRECVGKKQYVVVDYHVPIVAIGQGLKFWPMVNDWR